LAPLNPGCINSNHTHGTHVPVEEPSTASVADMTPDKRGDGRIREIFVG
jgi:hypothetical protein